MGLPTLLMNQTGSTELLNSDNNRETVAPVFLVEAEDYRGGCKKVLYFLDRTSLLKYDRVTFNADRSYSAVDTQFWGSFEKSLNANQQSIDYLIQELQESGYNSLSDLAVMQQGYESKMLHILTHFLDGFIGIDSSLYNLIEDSHQVSESLRQKIKSSPENYWLVQISADKLWTFL